MGEDRDQNGNFFLRAYGGDFKTLLAWNFASSDDADKLAGFSLQCKPPGKNAYHVYNFLTFKDPAAHARIAGEPDRSSANAPFHKFRWVHVPGLDHQGLAPSSGKYTYTVTPRYFDRHGHLTALDVAKSASVKIEVGPFVKDGLQVAFTRGYVQSQAFVNHFSEKAKFQPNNRTLIFDTNQQAGTTKAGI